VALRLTRRQTNIKNSGQLLPERRTTVLESILKPLEILNIPQQAVFRSVRALEEGRISALGESTRLSDIAPVKRGGVGEFAGTIVLDPLNFVGGFAAKTAIGATRKSIAKGLKDVVALESSLKTAKEVAAPIRFARKLGKEIKDVTGTVEEATSLARQLRTTKQAIRAQKVELARRSRGAAGAVLGESTLQPDRVLLKLNVPFTKKTLDLVSLDRFPKLLDSSALNRKVRKAERLRKIVGSPKEINLTQKTIDNLNRFKKGTPTERAFVSKVELVPIEELDKFKDIDRSITPKSSDQFSKLEKSIKEEGIKEPLILTYSKSQKAAYLGEGNTRLAVAQKLGIEALPVRVIRVEDTSKSLVRSASRRPLQPVEGFISKDRFGHVPADLKPSQIGVETIEDIVKAPTKNEIELAKLDRAIKYQPRGVLNELSPSLALRAARVRKFVREQIGERFRQGVNNETLQSLREIRKNRVVSGQIAFREGPLKQFSKEFQELFVKSGLDDIEEFNKRIIEGFEFRKFEKEALPSVQEAIDSARDKAFKKEFYTPKGDLKPKFEKLSDPELQAKVVEFMEEVQPKIALQKDPLVKQLKKIESRVGKLTKEVTMFVNNWGEHFDEILDIEKSLGVNIEKESSSEGWLSYLTRIISSDARKLKKKNKTLYRMIHADVNGRLGEAMRRKMFPKMDIVSINEMVKEKFGIDFNFFEEDVIKIITKRFDDHIAAAGDAQMAHAMFDIFGIEGEALRNGVSQEQYFKKIGLVGGRKDLFLTKEMETDAQRMNKIIQELNKSADSITMNIVGWVDAHINTFYRGLLTTPFPPFHNRNFIGNVVLMRQAGMSWLTIGKFLSKMRKLQWKSLHGVLDLEEARTWKELADLRIRGEGELSDIERQLLQQGSKEGFREFTNQPVKTILRRVTKHKFSDAPEVLGINQIPGLHAIPDNPLTSLGIGRGYGILLEEQARGALYLWKKSQKFSPLDAQRTVNKYLFDYSALSPFEKQRLAPLFLFYTWSRKNIPLQLKEMIQNPRFANVFQNITGFDQEDAPLYLRNGVSFPVPGLEDTFVGTLGFPIEDLSFLSVSDTDPNVFSQMRRVVERMTTRLAPAFRIPIELSMGKEAFTQRSLRNQKIFANPFKSFREFQNSFLVRNSPFSRAVRTAGDLMDSEDPTASKYLEFILGLRTSRVSKEKINLTNIKQRLLSTDEFKRPDPSLVIPVQPKEERSDITNARAKALNAALRALRKDNPRRRRRRRRR